MTWVLGGGAVVAAGLAGVVLLRRQGWDRASHRVALVSLLLPWAAQHASLARVVRSPSLNPLRRSVEGPVLAGDWVAPVILLALLAVCLARPRRLRAAAVLLPLVGAALVWWVTVPLYAGVVARGWVFLPDVLSGPGPFLYHLCASTFLAAWILPTLAWDRAGRGERAGASGS